MRTKLFLLLILVKLQLYCQVEYGNNPLTGKFHNVGDANIYYEVYGAGTPLILLHGGLYGHIDDYSDYIPSLQKRFKVIAIATRGHGKSEIGAKGYSEKLLASDVISILKEESEDSAVVI